MDKQDKIVVYCAIVISAIMALIVISGSSLVYGLQGMEVFILG